MKNLTSLPGWKGISGPPVTSTATTPASCKKEQREKGSKGHGQNAHRFGQIESSNQIDARSGADLVEIGIGEGGELLLDGLEQPHRDVQPRVGAVSQFRRALHSTEGTAGPRRHVERPRGVPPARLNVSCRSGNRKGSPPPPHKDLEMRARGREGLREAEHEGRAALLGDEGAELAPGLLDGLAVLGAHGWVILRHGCEQRELRIVECDAVRRG
jgi:hypothetical protein